MSLGTTISRLRAEKHLSQRDLADALGVSLQSVNKWETDDSVPEPDNLVKLSQLFGVSLDQLATGELALVQKSVPEPISPPASPWQIAGRKLMAVILLCMAFLIWLVPTAPGSLPERWILAAPLVICTAICLLVKKRPGLWCAWVLYAAADILLHLYTPFRWRFLFQPATDVSYSGLHFTLAFLQLGIMAVLVTGTVASLRDTAALPGKKQLLAGWCLWTAMQFISPSVVIPSTRLCLFFSSLLDTARLGLLAAMLTGTFRAYRKPDF